MNKYPGETKAPPSEPSLGSISSNQMNVPKMLNIGSEEKRVKRSFGGLMSMGIPMVADMMGAGALNPLISMAADHLGNQLDGVGSGSRRSNENIREMNPDGTPKYYPISLRAARGGVAKIRNDQYD